MGGAKKPEAERRADILAAAYEVALRDGLDGFTVRAVAKQAGLSTGLVFFHFTTRDGLLLALLDEVLTRTLDVQPVGADSPEAPWGALTSMLEVEIEGLVEQRAAVELLFTFYFARTGRLFRDPIDRALATYREAFLPVLQGRSGLDADSAASVAFAVIQGSAMQVIRTPDAFDATALLAFIRQLSWQDPSPT